MKREILVFGIILLFVGLAIMPSIQAIQQKTMEDKAYSDFIEKLEWIDLKDIGKLDNEKHPILYAIVIYLFNFLNNRRETVALRFGEIFWPIYNLLVEDPYSNFGQALYRIWILRGLMTSTPFWLYAIFWAKLSQALNWNWYFPPFSV